MDDLPGHLVAIISMYTTKLEHFGQHPVYTSTQIRINSNRFGFTRNGKVIAKRIKLLQFRWYHLGLWYSNRIESSWIEPIVVQYALQVEMQFHGLNRDWTNNPIQHHWCKRTPVIELNRSKSIQCNLIRSISRLQVGASGKCNFENEILEMAFPFLEEIMNFINEIKSSNFRETTVACVF